ncbi:hypothetical protein HDV57DRAFT_435496 [Trichoderma longibrachiatum]
MRRLEPTAPPSLVFNIRLPSLGVSLAFFFFLFLFSLRKKKNLPSLSSCSGIRKLTAKSLALSRPPLPRDPPHRLIEQIPSVGPGPWLLARPPPDFLRVWPQTVSSWPKLAPGTAAQWLNAYHRRPGYRSSGSPPVLPVTDHTSGWAKPSPLALRNGERHRNALLPF